MTFMKKQCERNSLQKYASWALMISGLAFLAIAMDGAFKFGGVLGVLDKQPGLRRVVMGVIGLAALYRLSCVFFYDEGALKKKGDVCAADCECASTNCSGGKCQ